MIKALLILFSFVFAVTFFLALDGLVFFCYWEWFVVPFGIVKINIFYAMAFAAFLKHFACDYQPSRKDGDGFGKAFDYLIFKPMFTFGFGLIIYLLMKLI